MISNWAQDIEIQHKFSLLSHYQAMAVFVNIKSQYISTTSLRYIAYEKFVFN
jgi:hypothetical protein